RSEEREGGLDLLYLYRNLTAFGDAGFVDQVRQRVLHEDTGNRLFTPKRANQREQNPLLWDQRMRSLRSRIETVYDQAKDQFHLEKTGAKTLWGLIARVIAKMTGMTIAAWVNKQNNRSPLVLAGFAW